jgi:hypothetical protein
MSSGASFAAAQEAVSAHAVNAKNALRVESLFMRSAIPRNPSSRYNPNALKSFVVRRPCARSWCSFRNTRVTRRYRFHRSTRTPRFPLEPPSRGAHARQNAQVQKTGHALSVLNALSASASLEA